MISFYAFYIILCFFIIVAPIGGVLFALEEGASFWHQVSGSSVQSSLLVSTYTKFILISHSHLHGAHSSVQ